MSTHRWYELAVDQLDRELEAGIVTEFEYNVLTRELRDELRKIRIEESRRAFDYEVELYGYAA